MSFKVKTAIKAGKYVWAGGKAECVKLGSPKVCKECCKSYFSQIGSPEPAGFCGTRCKNVG